MTDRVRRNGQLSSCEPCRKSKLRCDHSRPQCARCVKRKLSNQCVYHPAPMAQRKRSNADALLTPKSTSEVETINRATTASASSPVEESEILGRAGTGLLTMYGPSTPFAHSSSDSRPWAALTRSGLCIARSTFQPGPAHLEEGEAVLNTIMDLSSECESHIHEAGVFDFEAATFSSPVPKAAQRASRATLQSLRLEQDKLHKLTEKIFQQTIVPLELPRSPANGTFDKALSGENLRWEVIGLHCGLIAAFAVTAKQADSRFHEREQWKSRRKTIVFKAFETCMTCLNFCERCDSINDLTLWLLVVMNNVSTWCFGDDSYRSWALHSKLTSDIIALGFHKGFRDEASGPLYLRELRKRLIGFAYENSVLIPTFVGRPPQFNREFFILDLPSDVPDDVLMGDPQQLQRAIEELDANGWSKHPGVNPVLRNRTSLLQSPIREEVLELTFGSTVTDFGQRVHRIRSKLRAAWALIPQEKKYDPSMWDSATPRETATFLMCTKLEFHYTEFLLHKLQLQQNDDGRDKLIETSHEIVRTVLTALKKGNLLVEQWLDMEWMTVCFAMPCASVLILELCRQNRQPHLPTTVNRSTIIQDLSVLISSCDLLTENRESNHRVIKQAQAIFSRGLDQVLNQPPIPASQTLNTQPMVAEINQGTAVDPMDLGGAEMFAQDPEFSAWLESFDLQVDPWLTLPEFPTSG